MLAMGAIADATIVDSASKIQLLLEVSFGRAVREARVSAAVNTYTSL